VILPMLDPLGGSVLVGEGAEFVLVEVGPRGFDGFGFEEGGETGREVSLEGVPVDGGGDGGFPERALEEEAVLGAFLGGAGDFGAGVGVEHVVEFGAGEADGGAGRCGFA